jgi:exonuclease SbcC
MKPVRLSISGFLSYASKVEVDFEQFQLACISGANGAGKSTLLDAITWVLFGKARRLDDAIINNQSQKAEVELVFDYEGQRYRVQRVKPKGKTTVLEFALQTTDGSWKPLTESSITRTEAAICSTLRMDFELFTNASFFLQGKADQFTQQNPTNRKRILGSILGLDQWDIYRDAANQKRRACEDAIKELEGMLAEINVELSQTEERRNAFEQLDKDLKQISSLRTSKEITLDNLKKVATLLEQKRQVLMGQENSIAQLQQRLEDTKSKWDERDKEKTKYESTIKTSTRIQADYDSWQTNRQELDAWQKLAEKFQGFDTERQHQVHLVETERARLKESLKNLTQQQEKVQKAEKDLAQLVKLIENSRTEIGLLENKLSEKAVLEKEKEEIQYKVAEVSAKNKHLTDEMQQKKTQIMQLSVETGAACPLCKQPLADHDRKRLVAELQVEGKARGDLFRTNETELKEIGKRSSELERLISSLKKVEAQHSRLLQQLAEQQTRRDNFEMLIADWNNSGSEQFTEIAHSLNENSFANEIRLKITALDAQISASGYDVEKHKAVQENERKGRSVERDMRSLTQAKAALEPLTREIEDLIKQIDSDENELKKSKVLFDRDSSEIESEFRQQPDLEELQNEVEDIRTRENELRMEMGAARQKVGVLKSLEDNKIVKEARKGELNRQIALLQILERAFGKDGIPAQLIAEALPEIEQRANDILEKLSTGGMSVRFDAQREYKDKNREDKKETLDIILSDASGPRPYEMFSGGEAFRANFAIRLALSHLLAQRAGARLQTLVIDEGFGSQDADGRQKLIEAIHHVQGDFEKILIITHLDELKDAFPARIEVEKSMVGSQVRVIVA